VSHDAETMVVPPEPADPLERFLVVVVPPDESGLSTVVVEVEAQNAARAAREATNGEGPEGTVVYAAPWDAVRSFIVLLRPRDEAREARAAG
jgi:hypothetical protein